MKLSRSKFITVNALLCAIVLLFIFVPVSIGPVQLAFIPIVAVIISAEFIGLKNCLFTGLFFGLVSLTSAFIKPTLLSFAFQNPLISVLPRIIIGLSAYSAAKGFKKFFPKLPELISLSVGSVAGVLTNTIGVLGMLLLVYYGEPLEAIGSALNFKFIGVVIVTNSLLEILLCTVITPPIVIALKKAFRI